MCTLEIAHRNNVPEAWQKNDLSSVAFAGLGAPEGHTWGFPNEVMFCVDLPLLSQAWHLFIWWGCWEDVLKGDV